MRNLINGQELHASNGDAIEVMNPARNQLIATVPNSTTEDVEMAISAATIAQKKWEEVSVYERGEILGKFTDLVEDNFEILATTLSRESGKPITEARREVSNTKNFIKAYVERAKLLYETNNSVENTADQEKTVQFTIRQPLGVVAYIIPFNFPCDFFSQKIPSALIMGNSVIVNPPSSNPLTIHKFCLLLKEAGIPDGVINCISGRDNIVEQALARHNKVKLIRHKKIIKNEKQTMALTSKNTMPLFPELRSNNAFIVAADADIDLAVKEAIENRLYNAGQICCASKRFLVHNSVKDEFTKKLIERLRKIKVGDPLYISTELGCLISEKAAVKVEEQVRTTLVEGAILAFGGRRLNAFFEPTVLVNVKKDMSVMKNMEIFGPVIPICGFTTMGEAIEIANQSGYALCGNIISKDMNTATKAASKIEACTIIINGSSFLKSSDIPFEVLKNYEISNEVISSTLEEITKTKTIILKNVLK